jgi:hypothetical protein
VTQGLTRVDPGLSATEAARAATAATHQLAPAAVEPPMTVSWSLECTDHCPIAKELNGELRFTNTSSRAVALYLGRLVSQASGLVLIDSLDLTKVIIDTPQLTVGASMSSSLAFKYMCEVDATGVILGELSWRPGGQGKYPSASITCGNGDAVMLSENTRLTKSGTGWSAASPGATANVIAASPAVSVHFFGVGRGTQLYASVPGFTSLPGLSPLQLHSSLQTGTATFDGMRYAITGLTGSAVYAATDTLTVTHTPSDGGTPVTLSVAAPPPIADVTSLFGARAGLKTTVQLADGTFDVMFVSVVAGPPGAPAGQNGVLRSVAAADMTLVGNLRVAPLVDDETLAAMTELGWVAQTVYVAAYRQTLSPLFFPEAQPVPVQAGRMFQVSVADLMP